MNGRDSIKQDVKVKTKIKHLPTQFANHFIIVTIQHLYKYANRNLQILLLEGET